MGLIFNFIPCVLGSEMVSYWELRVATVFKTVYPLDACTLANLATTEKPPGRCKSELMSYCHAGRAFLVAQVVKNLPAVQETLVRFLAWEVPLEKELATHSAILAWRIPWTEESGRLQSMGSHRVGHDWSDLACMHDGSDGTESTCSVGDLGLIPGLERSPGRGHDNPSQCSFLENPRGQRSLAGCSPWGHRVGHDWATGHSTAPCRECGHM